MRAKAGEPLDLHIGMVWATAEGTTVQVRRPDRRSRMSSAAADAKEVNAITVVPQPGEPEQESAMSPTVWRVTVHEGRLPNLQLGRS
jgi:hypothetical protein